MKPMIDDVDKQQHIILLVHKSFATYLALGSPVSVTLATLVMEAVEERALFTCTHKPLF